jgi:acetyltransferase-like isoleucine patch superfamily enzyme
MDPILNVLSVTGGRQLPTCDLAGAETDHVAWVREPRILWEKRLTAKLYVILHRELPIGITLPDWVVPIWTDTPEWDFVTYHNEVWKDFEAPEPEVSSGTFVERTAQIGPIGMKIVQKNGQLLWMKHIGRIRIDSRGYIGPQAVVHRAKFRATILEDEVAVGAFGNIGHGAFIGRQTILAPGVLVGGSVRIGRCCFLGQGCNIRDNVRICDRVKIGMGAVVVKDIDEPGIYFGVPARRIGGWDGRW